MKEDQINSLKEEEQKATWLWEWARYEALQPKGGTFPKDRL